MQEENWDRFLPKFKKKNVQTKKVKKVKQKKEYTPFPPAQQPSKVDLAIESGEYFLSKKTRQYQKESERVARQDERHERRQQEREAAFVPPQERKDGGGRGSKKPKPNTHIKDITANVIEKLKRKSGGAFGSSGAATGATRKHL